MSQDPTQPQAAMTSVGHVPDLPAGGSALYLAGPGFTDPGLYVWTGSANVRVARLDELAAALRPDAFLVRPSTVGIEHFPPAHLIEPPADPGWLRRIFGRRA